MEVVLSQVQNVRVTGPLDVALGVLVPEELLAALVTAAVAAAATTASRLNLRFIAFLSITFRGLVTA
jgi:hypothetical protein